MKTINTKLIILVILTIAAVSCRKITDNVSTVVPVKYPTVTLIGPAYVHIPIGGSFKDPGATLVDDITGKSSTVTATTNEVNVNAPGVYAINYTAADANGFKTTATRTILVLNYSKPSTLAGNYDIEGAYIRVEGSVPVNVIRMDTGLYILDNFAGSGTVYPAYMTMPTDSTINVPAQTTFGGFSIATGGDTYNPVDSSFAYSVIADGFGTSVRHFQRVK